MRGQTSLVNFGQVHAVDHDFSRSCILPRILNTSATLHLRPRTRANLLLQWRQGKDSEHLYFFKRHLSQARMARGLLRFPRESAWMFLESAIIWLAPGIFACLAEPSYSNQGANHHKTR